MARLCRPDRLRERPRDTPTTHHVHLTGTVLLPARPSADWFSLLGATGGGRADRTRLLATAQAVYENDGPRGRCHSDLPQRRATIYKPLAQHGRVTHAAAHHRPSTDMAPTDAAPTAVRDRRGARLPRGSIFLAGHVSHATTHYRPSTDVAPTAVRDRRGAHLLRGYFFLAGRVSHAAADHRLSTDVAPNEECHRRRTHLHRGWLCPAIARPASNGRRGEW